MKNNFVEEADDWVSDIFDSIDEDWDITEYDINKDRKNKIKELLNSVDDLDSEDISNITKLLRKVKLKRIIDEK